ESAGAEHLVRRRAVDKQALRLMGGFYRTSPPGLRRSRRAQGPCRCAPASGLRLKSRSTCGSHIRQFVRSSPGMAAFGCAQHGGGSASSESCTCRGSSRVGGSRKACRPHERSDLLAVHLIGSNFFWHSVKKASSSYRRSGWLRTARRSRILSWANWPSLTDSDL